MIEFRLTEPQYIKMVRSVMRGRIFLSALAIYGVAWIVAWILFIVGECDAWSEIGSMGVLLLVAVPVAGLLTSIRFMARATRRARFEFKISSSDGYNLDIRCQLENGIFKYHFVPKDVLVELDLTSKLKVIRFNNFFIVQKNKSTAYYIPLNSETEELYYEICEQRSALQNK